MFWPAAAPAQSNREDEGQSLKADMEILRQSLQADMESLRQRVAALEAAAPAEAEVNLSETGDKPPEQGPPPASSGNEPVAPEGGCAIEVGGAQEETETEIKKLPAEAVDDTYTFSESTWDVQLFLGHALGPYNSMLTVAYSALNMVLQIFFCIIVWTMTSETVTDQTAEDFLTWRISYGHSYQNFDTMTNSSLVRRVCSGSGTNNVAGGQQASIASFNSYIPLGQNFQIGPVLCSMAVGIWIMTVMEDMARTESFMEALLSLKRASKGDGPSKITFGKDGQLHMRSLSLHRFLYAVFVIVLPRCVIDILLLLGGIRFLIYENTLPGLILNAVALGFILGLDEFFFLLLPRRAKRIVEIMEPVEKTVSFTNAKGRFDIRSALVLFGSAVAIFTLWVAYLQSKVSRMREAQRILCGGDLDFVWEWEAGTGQVAITTTGSELEVADAHSTLAVLQQTGLLLSGILASFAPKIPVDKLSRHVSLVEIDDLSVNTRSDNLLRLPCKDHDGSPVEARALKSLYSGGYGDGASSGSFCRSHTSWCTSPQWAEDFRKTCPTTCQCDTINLFNRFGCGSTCHLLVERKVKSRAEVCVDVPYRSNPQDLATFFANLVDFLVAQGAIEHNGARTHLTPAWRQALLDRTSYKYIMTVDDPAFPLNWNITTWLSTTAPATIPEDYFASPCQFVAFINAVFDFDICAPVDLLGSIRAWCPQACGVPGCGPAPRTAASTDGFDALARIQGTLNSQMILIPFVRCGSSAVVRTWDTVLFERPAWGNDEYTVDFCGASDLDWLDLAFQDTAGQQQLDWAGQGVCNATRKLDPRVPTFFFIWCDVDEVNKGTEITVSLACHVDGELACGSTVTGSTVGAVSTRGSPAGERVYQIAAPDFSTVSFDTCGSQLNAGLAVYNYRAALNTAGSLYWSQDPTSSCGSASGASLSMTMPPAAEHTRLVVEGSGSSEGNFTLRMACSLPRIQCGDTITGSTVGLRNDYGAASPERLWSFSTGNGGNVTFDTCRSKFDTDIRILTPNMTQLLHVDANPGETNLVCDWKAYFTVAFLPNETYVLLLEGYRASQGEFSIALRC